MCRHGNHLANMPAGRGGKQQQPLLEQGGGAGVSEHTRVTCAWGACGLRRGRRCAACPGASVRVHVGVLGVRGVSAVGARGVGGVPCAGPGSRDAGGRRHLHGLSTRSGNRTTPSPTPSLRLWALGETPTDQVW